MNPTIPESERQSVLDLAIRLRWLAWMVEETVADEHPTLPAACMLANLSLHLKESLHREVNKVYKRVNKSDGLFSGKWPIPVTGKKT